MKVNYFTIDNALTDDELLDFMETNSGKRFFKIKNKSKIIYITEAAITKINQEPKYKELTFAKNIVNYRNNFFEFNHNIALVKRSEERHYIMQAMEKNHKIYCKGRYPLLEPMEIKEK